MQELEIKIKQPHPHSICLVKGGGEFQGSEIETSESTHIYLSYSKLMIFAIMPTKR